MFYFKTPISQHSVNKNKDIGITQDNLFFFISLFQLLLFLFLTFTTTSFLLFTNSLFINVLGFHKYRCFLLCADWKIIRLHEFYFINFVRKRDATSPTPINILIRMAARFSITRIYLFLFSRSI